MNIRMSKSTTAGLTAAKNGYALTAGPVPEPTQLHRLSAPVVVLKTAAGTVLFLAWLLLFIMGMSLESSQYSKQLVGADHSVNWSNLVTYGLLFTPTNGAILASLAGVLGGIASNLAANNKFRYATPDLTDPHSDDFISYTYMTENPLVSMLRGFITYLIFIAGSYLTNFTTSADTKDPTQFLGLTAAAYFKFAVSISLLAYLAGYDPSRMKGLINSFSLTRKDPSPPTQVNVSQDIVGQKTENNVQSNPGTPAKKLKPVE